MAHTPLPHDTQPPSQSDPPPAAPSHDDPTTPPPRSPSPPTPPTIPLQNPIPGTTIHASPERLGLQPSMPAASAASASASAPTSAHDKEQQQHGGRKRLSRFGRGIERGLRKLRPAAGSRSEEDGGDGDGEDEDDEEEEGEGEEEERADGEDRSDTPTGRARPPAQAFDRPNKPGPMDLSASAPLPGGNEAKRPPLAALHAPPPTMSAAEHWRGGGSMRLGTQTLIQMLQAVPSQYFDERAEDADAHSSASASESASDTAASDSEDSDGDAGAMRSSLHAVHRPVARQRASQSQILPSSQPHQRTLSPVPSAPSSRSASASPPPSLTIPPRPPQQEQQATAKEDESESSLSPTLGVGALHTKHPDKVPAPRMPPTSAAVSQPPPPPRGAVEATEKERDTESAKRRRRARLAEKLADVFALEEVEDVVGEFPCWLMRSVLLEGYMYLTRRYICFFAHMPDKDGQTVKSGTLSKKASRTRRLSKYWFVLKGDVLSWYMSSTDPYFPVGNIALRYAIACAPSSSKDKEFSVRTGKRSYTFAADSVAAMGEWVKTIKKVLFRCQNEGESVKIVIPIETVVDVERSTSLDFADTIALKVVDGDTPYSVDTYHFAYFPDIQSALSQIRDVYLAHRETEVVGPELALEPDLRPIQDTTGIGRHQQTIASPPTSPTTTSGVDTPVPSRVQSEASGPRRLESRLREEEIARSRSEPPEGAAAHEPLPQHGVIVKDVVASPAALSRPSLSGTPSSEGTRSSDSTINTCTPTTRMPSSLALPPASSSAPAHTYPPAPTPTPGEGAEGETPEPSWSVPIPSWLRSGGSKLGRAIRPTPTRKVSEVLESPALERSTGSADYVGVREEEGEGEGVGGGSEYSMMERSLGMEEEEEEEARLLGKFREAFALPGEKLLGHFPGALFRVLPTSGKVYVSENYLCFRSTQILMKTKMIIPLSDIQRVVKQKPLRLAHHGLVVIVKGHEELFLEFTSSTRRDACMQLLNRQLEDAYRRESSAASAQSRPSNEKREAMILEELEALHPEVAARPPPQNADAVPPVMFTSTSSSFVTFRPQDSLHFTCLTIGSRGDVQPYIALCKGLKAEGHKVRIATHAEYRDWIEGHGIEFRDVGGDPAELMRICVEHGMFTLSFMKEGLTKFRSWLDDLLCRSWKACQGTDILIESPSAMGGLHIAEALQIPYYRAFTMPWTRTRAYPHAFAVPEHKMGGSYNYMSYTMFDQVFWRAISGQVNRWRKSTLGLQSTNLDKMEQHKVPFLYCFSPSLVPPPLDWYEWIHVTGYWFLDDPDSSADKKWQPPQDLVEFIDRAQKAHKKVVYIGFGSIVVSDPDAMTACIVEAIQEADVYAILSKGWSDRLASKKSGGMSEEEAKFLPENIHNISSIDHGWLFPRIDAACHHGGAGTTGASLRAGIPTIIKPFFGDQFFNADRVEAIGVGSSVRKLTVEHLAEALKTATTDKKVIEKARLVGEQIRSEDGVANTISAIYRDLDYAKTLIKHDTRLPNAPPPNNPTLSPASSSSPEGRHTTSDEWSMPSLSEEDEQRRPSEGSKSDKLSLAAPTSVVAMVTSTIKGLPSSLLRQGSTSSRRSGSTEDGKGGGRRSTDSGR